MLTESASKPFQHLGLTKSESFIVPDNVKARINEGCLVVYFKHNIEFPDETPIPLLSEKMVLDAYYRNSGGADGDGGVNVTTGADAKKRGKKKRDAKKRGNKKDDEADEEKEPDDADLLNEQESDYEKDSDDANLLEGGGLRICSRGP
jgi:hypothetical protein